MQRPNDSRLATAAFIAAIVALVAVAAFSRSSATAAFDDVRWVEHTMRARLAIGDLATTVERAVDGDAERAQVDDRVRTIEALTRDNAEQQANVRRLEDEIDRGFRGDAAALHAARDTMKAMDLCEERLLAGRTTQADESRVEAHRMTGWGFFAAAAAACVAMLIYRRSRAARARVEAELRASEEIHRLLADHASDMVTVRAVGGGLVYSHNAEKILGWRDEELLVDDVATIHEDDRAMMTDAMRRLVAGETPGMLRFRAKDPSGAWRWLESTSTVIRDGAGAAISIRSATRDVTKQVELEQALGRTEKLYRTIVENAPNAVLLLDRDLRCVMAGGALAKDGGNGMLQSIRGQRLDEWALPENAARIAPIYRDVLAGNERSFEVTRDGNVYVCQAVPVRDENGEITGLMSISTDVTAMRLETRALERTTAHLNALLDNLQFGVFFEDVDRTTRRANHAFAALHGTTPSEFLGLDRGARLDRFRTIFAEPDTFAAATEAHLAAGATVLGETLRCADGRILERDYVPVRVDGEIIGHLWCLHDVSVEHATQAILRKQSDELHALSTRDELTSLVNRRGLFAGAGELLGQAARNGRTAAVLFADLNGMKSINDSLGHEEGDRALVEAARVLERVFPSDAIIARLGGDEFVVLFTAHDPEDADDARASLRDEILAFNARGERAYRLSMSVGLALADAPFPPLDTLLSRADGAMYEQKRARRALAVSLPPVRSASRTNLIAVAYPAASAERL